MGHTVPRRFNGAFALLCTAHAMHGCPTGVMIGGQLVEHALLDRFVAAWRRLACPEAAGRDSGVSARLQAIGIPQCDVALVLTVLLAGLVGPRSGQ